MLRQLSSHREQGTVSGPTPHYAVASAEAHNTCGQGQCSPIVLIREAEAEEGWMSQAGSTLNATLLVQLRPSLLLHILPHPCHLPTSLLALGAFLGRRVWRPSIIPVSEAATVHFPGSC